MVNVPAYLDRINYAGGPTSATVETLRGLHRCHMLTVPFENLDIGLGRKILCDEDAFIRKIVGQRRGGFCYEMNGAFAALLRELGFRVTLLSARVASEDGGSSPEFDHLTLRVDLDEPWLADVGFGDCFVEPLHMRPGVEQLQGERRFRIVDDRGSMSVEMAEAAGMWTRQYSFGLTPRSLHEFAPRCEYHQTSPESTFTQKRVCTKARPDGRITLADKKLVVTRNGKKEERLLKSEDEWRALLNDHFGIRL
jgi:N-hydroxyarylamine O-acetyltransferase